MLINNNYFGFKECSSFRNCSVCPYRLICFKSAQTFRKPSPSTPPVCNTEELEKRITELEKDNQILENQKAYLNRTLEAITKDRNDYGKRIQELTAENNRLKEQLENNNCKQLQSLEVKEEGLSVLGEEQPQLVEKKGLFGKKYVEQKPKKK